MSGPFWLLVLFASFFLFFELQMSESHEKLHFCGVVGEHSGYTEGCEEEEEEAGNNNNKSAAAAGRNEETTT